jgi:HEPN domain-containing protein
VKDDVLLWWQSAERDLRVATLTVQDGLYDQCIFHCQQALEKALKAVWIDQRGGVPPKTHNIAGLATELALELPDDRLKFLQRLAEQYLPSRYADFQIEYSVEQASYYYENTSEMLLWLRQQLN